MDTPLHERVRLALAPIAGTLAKISEDAVTTAESAASVLEIPHTDHYQPTRVHMARARMHKRLCGVDLGPWALDLGQRNNTPIHLRTEGLALRFLHTSGVVPAPGTNLARQYWYSNQGLFDDEALVARSVEMLLLLWTADFAAGTAFMRVVHPVGTWKYGEKAQTDLSIPLNDLEFFEDGGFDTRDDEEDLVMPSKREAAEETQEGAGSVSA
ncbi:hypothetical protein [Leucobacter muris]|uniref:hypothetical protein n=1 Tax=Leucobacter muris TaxID=1935379 RepID=UPI0013E38392|nr:hypothetical protein [Leucobacter muris]